MTRRALVLVAVLLAACSSRQGTATGIGIVKEVRPDLRQIVLAHDDIADVMPAMTMNFDVATPDLLRGIAAGDRVRFGLLVGDGRFRIVELEKVAGGEVAAEPGGGIAAVTDEDDLAPGFTLVDHDGRTRSLDSLRGKVVLLDFVYTTCPGPCPILTSAHVRVQRQLPERLRPHVWFASVSLDPRRDTPERLRDYATARGADLASWSFFTGPPETVEAVLNSYGVGAVPESNGLIQHVVVTFLIDGEGRIGKRYFGLDHDAGEYVRDIAANVPG